MTTHVDPSTATTASAWADLQLQLAAHGRPGTLVAICGVDGSGKTTLEEGLVSTVAATAPASATWMPTQWWKRDRNIRRTLFDEGDGQVLPEEALLHFNLADCHAHQTNSVLPALGRGDFLVCNRYVYDSLALFEARARTAPPDWLVAAVGPLVKPDFGFILDGPAEVLVERVVRRDGPNRARFDQDVEFTERYNAALRRMAETYGLTVLNVEDDRGQLLKRCLEVIGADERGRSARPGGPPEPVNGKVAT